LTDVGHLVSDEDDGDDKMLKGAERENKSMYDIAQTYIDEFKSDLESLGITGVDKKILSREEFMSSDSGFTMPRATDYIDQQINIINDLESKDLTYVTSDGVYMDTSKVTDYGKLAKLDIKNLQAGARVEMSEKKSPTDFALWKFATDPRRTEMIWPLDKETGEGKGFPGWHLECSAFIEDLFEGQTIDIHAGGIDHIPVHHTNEIAQSESLHRLVKNQPDWELVKIWLHGNFLKVDGQKISKSLNNSILLKDIFERGYTPDDLRMFVLQSHYRTEANFTWEGLEAAKARFNKWKNIGCLVHQITLPGESIPTNKSLFMNVDLTHKLSQLDYDAPDLNTPLLLTLLEADFEELIKTDVWTASTLLVDYINSIDKLTGFSLSKISDINSEAKVILADRQQARNNKDFTKSDELRDELTKMGIGVKDGVGGQIWYWL
jgi:cysteinyl-tRNA synthetase